MTLFPCVALAAVRHEARHGDEQAGERQHDRRERVDYRHLPRMLDHRVYLQRQGIRPGPGDEERYHEVVDRKRERQKAAGHYPGQQDGQLHLEERVHRAGAEHLNMSRSLAETRYRAATGETIHATIENMRMDRLKHLLVSTNRTVAALAAECGYRNANSLSHLFSKRFGISMRDYRAGLREGRAPSDPSSEN